MAPSHYLNQCWLTINETLWHSFTWGRFYKKCLRYIRGQWVNAFTSLSLVFPLFTILSQLVNLLPNTVFVFESMATNLITRFHPVQYTPIILHLISALLCFVVSTWWRHQMETFSALLAICVGNSPVTGEFPTQRPVTRSFDIFFELYLNKHLSK